MSAPAADVALAEPAGDGPIDLSSVENTRLGLKVAGIGVLLVLLTVPGSPQLEWLVMLVRALGWIVLGTGVALLAPTPDGPLPRWLQPPYSILCLLAALRIGKQLLFARFHVETPVAIVRIEQGLVILLIAAVLLLPWILWRFCQHRGLTGRALSWLWSAVLLLAAFAVHWRTRTEWLVWAYPALGLLLFVLCRQTARDVWLDAVNRQSKAVARTAG